MFPRQQIPCVAFGRILLGGVSNQTERPPSESQKKNCVFLQHKFICWQRIISGPGYGGRGLVISLSQAAASSPQMLVSSKKKPIHNFCFSEGGKKDLPSKNHLGFTYTRNMPSYVSSRVERKGKHLSIAPGFLPPDPTKNEKKHHVVVTKVPNLSQLGSSSRSAWAEPSF